MQVLDEVPDNKIVAEIEGFEIRCVQSGNVDLGWQAWFRLVLG